ncbi:MAG: 4-hydroxy-tetrahydrodipicolinate synthase [Acidiferrobacterales bacterium]|nr:4-hydroxy-tetrahydrodipicolinate synthase [Acidiferrobacterales bacterium]
MKLKGSLVALITPMNDSGEVDYNNLTALIEHHIVNGTHGIVSVGTTGESATLTVDEHLAVIEHTIKTVAGRIPVVAGTGGNSTREAIHLTRKAHELKADACLLVVPYYNKPTQEGMYQHFKTIANAVPIPQILYNVPGRTVADMANETIDRLASIENIVAIKDATGDMQRGRELIDICADRIAVLSGDDPTALELMRLGGVGDISVTANVAPQQMSQLCEAALNRDFDKADQIDQLLRPLHENLFVEANPIPVKYAVAKQGFTSNSLRLPLTPLSFKYESVLDQAMASIDA